MLARDGAGAQAVDLELGRESIGREAGDADGEVLLVDLGAAVVGVVLVGVAAHLPLRGVGRGAR